jgi:hypothetical protein
MRRNIRLPAIKIHFTGTIRSAQSADYTKVARIATVAPLADAQIIIALSRQSATDPPAQLALPITVNIVSLQLRAYLHK